MTKHNDTKAWQVNRTKKWVPGDLLTVSGTKEKDANGDGAYAVPFQVFEETRASDRWSFDYLTTQHIPPHTPLLFLGKVVAHKTNAYDQVKHFAKVWWRENIWMVDIVRLRLITNGKPKPQNPV